MTESATESVSAEYEARWTDVAHAIEAEIAAGEDELCRFIHGLHRRTSAKQTVGRILYKAFGLQPGAVSFALQRAGRSLIADTLLDHAEGVDAVVELGAGWGYNLFNLWLRGGPRAPYHALELTEAGCDAAAAIAARFPEARVSSRRYDFLDPALGPLAGASHALVFTNHAIDKIPDLPRRAVEQVIACAPKVTAIHFEAIINQLGELEAPADLRFSRKVERQDANANLYPLLRELEAEGRLRIDEVRPNVMGGHSSMIRWSAGG